MLERGWREEGRNTRCVLLEHAEVRKSLLVRANKGIQAMF